MLDDGPEPASEHFELTRKRQRLAEEKSFAPSKTQQGLTTLVKRVIPRKVGTVSALNKEIGEFVHKEGCALWTNYGAKCANSFIYQNPSSGGNQKQSCATYCASKCSEWISQFASHVPTFHVPGTEYKALSPRWIYVLIQQGDLQAFFKGNVSLPGKKSQRIIVWQAWDAKSNRAVTFDLDGVDFKQEICGAISRASTQPETGDGGGGLLTVILEPYHMREITGNKTIEFLPKSTGRWFQAPSRWRLGYGPTPHQGFAFVVVPLDNQTGPSPAKTNAFSRLPFPRTVHTF